MNFSIGDIEQVVNTLSKLKVQEAMNNHILIASLLIVLICIFVIIANRIAKVGMDGPTPGGKIAIAATCIVSLNFAYSMLETVPLSEMELKAFNTLREMRGAETYTPKSYINYVVIADEVAMGEKFVQEVEDLRIKIMALDLKPSESLLIGLSKQNDD